jgi:hypothetical protein
MMKHGLANVAFNRLKFVSGILFAFCLNAIVTSLGYMYSIRRYSGQPVQLWDICIASGVTAVSQYYFGIYV